MNTLAMQLKQNRKTITRNQLIQANINNYELSLFDKGLLSKQDINNILSRYENFSKPKLDIFKDVFASAVQLSNLMK